MDKKGRLFIVSAPAGTGKTTLVKMLHAKEPQIVESISYTTREPRPEEEEGKDYFFISKEEFQQKITKGEFLEFVELYGTLYGTSRTWVEKQLEKGKHVVLVIDTQGALLMRGKAQVPLIFIAPPSLTVLKERLEKRGTESEGEIAKRLEWAKKEMDVSRHYDYLIVNDDLETALDALRSIIVAEEHKII
ncbi:MAG: guanylate kinase [Chlamydiales bacterium]|nr:guanylate kinase [Chlamydiia bacterium]MCP5507278.1 guanylate kinase [Chlamydiales bacterium]